MGDLRNLSYEDVQKQRVRENLQRMKELGLRTLSKDLSKSKAKLKPLKAHKVKAIGKLEHNVEARRSVRLASTPQPNYKELDCDFPDFGKSKGGKNPKRQRSITSVAREAALAAAEAIETIYPSFIKSVVRRSCNASHFRLDLPKSFCQQHMPTFDTEILLEDDQGVLYKCLYDSNEACLTRGWYGFILDCNLEDGDAIVFELVKPSRFKLHIVDVVDYEFAEPVMAIGCATKKSK